MLGKEFKESLLICETERGEKITLSDYIFDYADFLAELRIRNKVISGCAQSGKSMFAILFYSWFASKCGFNSFFVFPTVIVKDKLVGTNHKPLINSYERIYSGGKRSSPTNNLSIHQCHNGATIRWIGVTKNSSDRTAASKNVVSFSADMLLVDEISQYDQKDIEKLDSRLNASRNPHKNRYYIGTKGFGMGAEYWIKQCSYQFYPAVTCPSCGELTFLHPFGALFKKAPVKLSSGETIESYLNESNRPIKWLHHDETRPIETAYISCTHCDYELPDELIRGIPNSKGVFRGGCRPYDVKTKISLQELLEAEIMPTNVSIEFSPLQFGNDHIKSIEVIKKGLYDSDVDDWLQQTCGVASDYSSLVITEEQIRNAFGHPVPFFRDYKKQVVPTSSWDKITVAGLDAGRASDFLVIMNVYYQTSIHNRQIIESAIREIIFIDAVARSDIQNILENYQVTYGLVDAYPSVEAMASLVDDSNGILQLAVQKAKQMSDFKVHKVKDGGQEYECIFLSHWKRIREIITTFSTLSEDGCPRYRFHDRCQCLFTGFGNEIPYNQLTTISFDPSTGKPNRPDNHQDDRFYALMFAESAFQYFIDQDQSVGGNIQDWLEGFS